MPQITPRGWNEFLPITWRFLGHTIISSCGRPRYPVSAATPTCILCSIQSLDRTVSPVSATTPSCIYAVSHPVTDQYPKHLLPLTYLYLCSISSCNRPVSQVSVDTPNYILCSILSCERLVLSPLENNCGLDNISTAITGVNILSN